MVLVLLYSVFGPPSVKTEKVPRKGKFLNMHFVPDPIIIILDGFWF